MPYCNYVESVHRIQMSQDCYKERREESLPGLIETTSGVTCENCSGLPGELV